MRVWVDDVRPALLNYVWDKSVDETKRVVLLNSSEIEVIDIDDDAGSYSAFGGRWYYLYDKRLGKGERL